MQWRQTIAVVLGTEFEEVRKECGDRPITVSSGYRPRAYNISIGSKRRSQHPKGTAIDCWKPAGITLVQFHIIVIGVAKSRKVIRGVGLYPWGVHFDVRLSSRLVRWKGSRRAPEVVK